MRSGIPWQDGSGAAALPTLTRRQLEVAIIAVTLAAVLLLIRHHGEADVGVQRQRAIGWDSILWMGRSGVGLILSAMNGVNLAQR